MNADQFIAKLNDGNGPDSLYGVIPKIFTISAAGPYPLAKHVEIAGSDIGGELLIGFSDLAVKPVQIVAITPDPAGDRVTVTLAPSELSGRFELFALETPQVELDTGGLMAPLALVAMQSAGDTPTITEQQYDQLQQANDQRAKLNQTLNGQIMVQAYDAHNDAYNDVFNANAKLRDAWAKGGATQQMMDYTSTALDTGAVVNPTDRTFGTGNLTYNQNALSQKLNVYFACIAMKQPHYDAAAEAALTFGNQVNTQTGNTQSNVVPMTGDQVYGVVNNPPAPPPPTLDAIANPVTEARVAQLGAAFARIATDDHSSTDIELMQSHGYDMDGDTLQRVQAIYAEGLRISDAKQRLAIRSGPFAIALPQADYVFEVTSQPNDVVTVRLARTTLAIRALGLGAETWDDEPSDVARERLEEATFMLGIIEDRIASQLTRIVRGLAAPRA